MLNRSHLHFEVALNLKLLGDLIKFNENHSCSTKIYCSTHLVIPEEIKQQHEDLPQLSTLKPLHSKVPESIKKVMLFSFRKLITSNYSRVPVARKENSTRRRKMRRKAGCVGKLS